jgi:FdhD protein
MTTNRTGARSAEVDVIRRRGPERTGVRDAVAVEDPLEIRLAEVPIAVTMRTPGDDHDLVRGFLLTEAILLDPAEIAGMEHVDGSRLTVRLRDDIQLQAEQFQRNMFVSSSCGVCGKASIEQVELMARRPPAFSVSQDVLAHLTDQLRDRQPVFDQTGGLHAAGLFDVHGRLLAVREDVGRHNAVDKAIGAAVKESWPLPPSLLVVSGRQSFEIVQKAAMAGIGGVVGVSAPSSLAVELAEKLGMLLVGFARGEGFNVYAGEERLTSGAA